MSRSQQTPRPGRPALPSLLVNNRREVRDFLVSRRANVTPEQAGLTAFGTNRRVPGLRREEVAMLAGVSVDYYTRLERGNLAGASESVLDAVAGALQLDDVERAHLFDLARAATPTPPPAATPAPAPIGAGVQNLLDAMTGVAAFLRNGRLDVLGANHLGYALYSPSSVGAAGPSTSPATSSSTPARATSTRTGTASPPPRREPAGRGRAGTRSTPPSPPSSATSRCAATTSACGGRRTTSPSTARAPSRSGTPRRRPHARLQRPGAGRRPGPGRRAYTARPGTPADAALERLAAQSTEGETAT